MIVGGGLMRVRILRPFRAQDDTIGGPGTEANFAAASSLAIGLKSQNTSYGQATDDNFDGDIAHTDMVFSSNGWAGGARDAVVDLTNVDYNGNVWVAVHNPAGTGTTIVNFAENEYYQIPYRCLLPKEYTNLLVAGRCISSTQEAQASYRIMPIVATLGEAAGTAISVAKADNSAVRDVDIKKVQNILVLHK